MAVTTDSLNVNNNTIVLDAWLESANRQAPAQGVDDNANPHYIDAATIKYSKTAQKWSADALKWRRQVYTNFWAVYPQTLEGKSGLQWPGTLSSITDAQEKTPNLKYDMSSYAGTDNAAEKTRDILTAYCRGYLSETPKTKEQEIVLDFEHLLSAISFKKGHIDDGYQIDSIIISGVQYKGTCNLVGFTVGIVDTLSISWSFDDINKPKDSLSFCQKITTQPTSEGGYYAGGKYFFMIPQAMPATATLSAVIAKGSSRELKQVELAGYSWKPGYKYEYSLSYFKNKDELEFSLGEYNLSENGSWTD